jgi:hypothetical protein
MFRKIIVIYSKNRVICIHTPTLYLEEVRLLVCVKEVAYVNVIISESL